MDKLAHPAFSRGGTRRWVAYRPARDFTRATAGFGGGALARGDFAWPGLAALDVPAGGFGATGLRAAGLGASAFATTGGGGGGAAGFLAGDLDAAIFATGAFGTAGLGAEGLAASSFAACFGAGAFTADDLAEFGTMSALLAGTSFVAADGGVAGRRAEGDAGGFFRSIGSPVMLEMSSSYRPI